MIEHNDELPTRDEIRAETDLRTLEEWHEEALDLLDSLRFIKICAII